MSTRRGHNAKKGQRHQNTKAYKNDLHDTSKVTKQINGLVVGGVCARCREIIEWRKKFKKYKPLAAPKKWSVDYFVQIIPVFTGSSLKLQWKMRASPPLPPGGDGKRGEVGGGGKCALNCLSYKSLEIERKESKLVLEKMAKGSYRSKNVLKTGCFEWFPFISVYGLSQVVTNNNFVLFHNNYI